MLVLVLVLAACGPAVDVGEAGTGSAGSTATETAADGASEASGGVTGTSAEGSTGEGPAACGGVCFEPPGDPWRGPVSIATVEDPSSVSCPSGYPQSIATFGHTLINGDEPCECRCSPPSGASCSAPLAIHDAPGCGGEPVAGTIEFGCTLVESGGSVELGTPSHTEACEPWSQPPNSDFDLHTVLCEGELSPTCEGGGACAPAPGLDGRVCWWAPGEAECPPGLPERLVVYSAVDDQRSCAEGCACAGSPMCTGGVLVHESCDEMPPKRAPLLLPEDCRDLAGPVALTSDFGITNDCTPTVPSVPVTGEFYEDAPQTLCCTAV